MSQPEPKPAKKKKSRDAKPETPPEILVKVSWCKACGLCVDYCNRGVLEMDGPLPKIVNAEKCNRCMLCEDMCPDFAIEVKDTVPEPAGQEKEPS